MAISMDMSLLRYGCLSQRRWATFADRAVRALLRTYAAMVCTLFVARASRRRGKEQRKPLLMINTNFVFLAALHFLQNLMQVYHWTVHSCVLVLWDGVDFFHLQGWDMGSAGLG